MTDPCAETGGVRADERGAEGGRPRAEPWRRVSGAGAYRRVSGAGAYRRVSGAGAYRRVSGAGAYRRCLGCGWSAKNFQISSSVGKPPGRSAGHP